MRRLASGTILYGYDSVSDALRELPRQRVWVAPNALYEKAALPDPPATDRNSVLYVGRLEASKKVELLVRAFAQSTLPGDGHKLIVVGDGSERAKLEELAQSLNISQSVDFKGEVRDVNQVRTLYSRAFCAASPGYVGLSLTQAFGFGVPMVVADKEPHAPEIELRRFGGVRSFVAGSPDSLATALETMAVAFDNSLSKALHAAVRTSYSAEAMATGLEDAILDRQQHLGEDGWPM